MYTSDKYNSRILEDYVMAKLEKAYGPDKHLYLQKMRERRSDEDDAIPIVATIDPNAPDEPGAGPPDQARPGPPRTEPGK